MSEETKARIAKSAELLATIGADRILLALLPDGPDLLSKIFTEILALLIAIVVISLVAHQVLARPVITLTWTMGNSAVDGPAARMNGTNRQLNLATSLGRSTWLGKWVLKNLDQVPVAIHFEPSGAARISADQSLPLGHARMVSDSELRLDVRCRRGDESHRVRLEALKTTTERAPLRVTLSPSVAGLQKRRVRWLLRIDSSVKYLQW